MEPGVQLVVSRWQVSCCSRWQEWQSHVAAELLLSSRTLVKAKDQALVAGVVVNLQLLLLAPPNLFWSTMLLPSNMLCVWKTECGCSVVCLLSSASRMWHQLTLTTSWSFVLLLLLTCNSTVDQKIRKGKKISFKTWKTSEWKMKYLGSEGVREAVVNCVKLEISE